MKFQVLITFLATFSATVLPVSARLTMPNVFTDNMVLQADTAAALWGTAIPGAHVRACGSWGAEAETTASADGHWRMTIATPAASFTPLSLTITDTAGADTLRLTNILAGEVWVASGQSNMEMPLKGFWNQPVEGGGDDITFSRSRGRGIRFVTVPKAGSYEPQTDFEGRWVESTPEHAGDFSAVAWHFATSLRDILDTPVGMIVAAYGGSKVEGWEPPHLIARYSDRDMARERADTAMNEYERVGVMYNAMLLPVAGYTARGFLWNQGESNVGAHDSYPARQADMVGHWRQLWDNAEMPFIFTELPPWDYGAPQETFAALFREAQHRAAASTPHAYIVCTSDLIYPDEADDVHARNKRPIGQRMARAAATYTYGVKGIPHTYPTFRQMDRRGPEAILWFNDAWQGFTPNEDLTGFEVAGADRVFHPAKAVIDRENMSITVSAPEVRDVEAVRYCFRNFAIGRLHDMVGMPVVPFRTDNWEN